MPEQTVTPVTQKSNFALWMCVAAIVYLAFQLHDERQRTSSPTTPGFENRIEPLHEEGNIWNAGYYYQVGKVDPALLRTADYTPPQVLEMGLPGAAQRRQQQQPQQPQRQSQRREIEDPNLREMQRANNAWDQYLRSQEPEQLW